ncbi:MAG: hypothetical protein U1F71_13545 [Verrucomicrobiaceae bacterium]
MSNLYQITPNTASPNTTYLAVYNQFTGQTFYADIYTYYLQDGDIIQMDPTYYDDGSGNIGSNAPPLPEGVGSCPVPDYSFSVNAIPENGDPVIEDIIVYDPNQEPTPTADTLPEDNYYNYPGGDDTTGTGIATDPDPGSVEVDLSYFDDYEQYYDEDNEPVYEGSDCDSSIGIRG